jgi:hypothetical protein
MSSDAIWQFLDRAGIIIGIVMFAPVLYSAWALMMERRRKKIRIEKIRSTPGSRPSVLIVDVKKPDTESMRAQVENYLRSGTTSIVVPDEAIFLAEYNGIMNSKDMDKFMIEVRKKVGKAVAYGTDKIHLFMRGPFPVIASVGEYLSNSNARIILHHSQPGEGYQNWGLLNR